MTTWFTSDMHFGHKNICELAGRPFGSVEEMNAALIERWCERVAGTDEVFVLGDAGLGPWREVAPILAGLPGVKILLPGNHDQCWYGHKRHTRWVERFREEAGFATILNMRQSYVALPGFGTVDLAHFPYRGDGPDGESDLRYLDEWPNDRGRWLLHGHVHERWKVWGEARMVNVGVDVWDFAPVSEDDLVDVLRAWTA